MPIRLTLPDTFAQRLAAADRGLAGMWVCSGSTAIAEIAAGSGLDWLLIDGEHSPLSLESIQQQLQAVAAYPVTPVVRVPVSDTVLIKQYLDLGAQNLLVPMINTAEQAEAAVAAAHYPPRGVRGVGSALARAARWNRVESYLQHASEHVSVTVQIETAEAVERVDEIAAVDGVDALFVGPSDLAASMGLLGQQGHPDVVAGVQRALEAGRAAGKPVGVNAFDPALATKYFDDGVDFILVGADVAMLARGSEALAAKFIEQRLGTAPEGEERASY
ncbi:HpcH/HpaI aldolase/citrate lyase family protein [Gulosibacter sp. 10]|uniref:HpcH/HpaI aldolase family protein n=1 Tax=Gulosibacter sp. 10 TaxID=1255570 RepID=UPI00097F1CE3|nr:aldolase/citrate lyase family protein [Gulosibacter sp. 10]SJM60441.1 2,4-dihydroxyhept-2-ene-1,7-dioic acid aldolase [Gulosibacter sp. 10]